MNALFDKLGNLVLKQWKQENFSLEKFPDIACKALNQHPPQKQVDLAAFMKDFLLNEDQPFQTDSDFGQPEIIVYRHPRFYIQLLFWMDGTTAIHQHGFSGAFHVMRGSSIHAEYDFKNSHAITSHLRVGNLRLKKTELLPTGRTVPILSGQGQIHSLFHLDSPSISVVVRTQHDPGTDPQFNYLPPHIAIDPLHNDPLTVRRTQMLDVLEQVEDSAYAKLVIDMIADLDFESGFYVLRHSMEYLHQTNDWPTAMTAFKKKHTRLAAGVEATFHEEVRRSIIKSLRSSITEPDHRFFLALLMNCEDKKSLLTLVAQRFPKHLPANIILQWAEELMQISEDGVSILDAGFPPSLNIDLDTQPQLFLSTFAYFLRNDKKLPIELRNLSVREVKKLHTALVESSLSILIVQNSIR